MRDKIFGLFRLAQYNNLPTLSCEERAYANFEPFDVICPDIALLEQLVELYRFRSVFGIPAWPLRAAREFYCTEPVVIVMRSVQFFRSDNELEPQVLASVNFGWERPRFYRKWSSDPELWREMAGPTLERFSEQGPDAESFLALFKDSAKQPAFVDGFRRHYALVKDMLARGKWMPSWY